MKKLILMLAMIMMLGCFAEDTGSNPSYEISELYRGYDGRSPIEGVITNTGDCTMKDIIVVAFIQDQQRFLIGSTEKAELRSGDSTEFNIAVIIGTQDFILDEIEYRVYYDIE